MRINFYLTFDGTAEAAMTFYQSLLGGELVVMHFDQMPDTSMLRPEDHKRVANAQLKLPNCTLMASDTMGENNMGNVFKGHSGFDIQIAETDVDRGRALFDALAEGGHVGMPYQQTFWAKGFGTCTDRFGVHWQVNVE